MHHVHRLLVSAAFLLYAGAIHAQDVAPAFKTEAQVATQQLAALVSLDDARQLPVRRLTQVRLTQEAEARQVYSNDAGMLQQKLSAIGQEYTAQLAQLLAPAQYQRYLAAPPGALPASVAAVGPSSAAQPLAAQVAGQLQLAKPARPSNTLGPSRSVGKGAGKAGVRH